MSRVYSVSVHRRVTVYTVGDYHRTATWMCITLHNIRFRGTIERIELILSPIFIDVHRMTIRIDRLNLYDT